MKPHSQDSNIIKKQPETLTFHIHYKGEEVLKVKLNSSGSTEDLLQEVRHRLDKQIPHIAMLASMDHNEVMDHTLALKQYTLSNYKDGQNLQLILREPV